MSLSTVHQMDEGDFSSFLRSFIYLNALKQGGFVVLESSCGVHERCKNIVLLFESAIVQNGLHENESRN